MAGPSDKGILMMRRRYFAEMEAVAADQEPKGTIRDPELNKCLPLPILQKQGHAEGMTLDEIDPNPVMAMRLKRFSLHAGQPADVRAAYEAAMGFEMPDETAAPSSYHL